jgi:hypothetical protein
MNFNGTLNVDLSAGSDQFHIGDHPLEEINTSCGSRIIPLTGTNLLYLKNLCQLPSSLDKLAHEKFKGLIARFKRKMFFERSFIFLKDK